jgi:hypothetical protein
MAFCFSFSSGVIWRSGDKLIPGIGIWAEAAPISKAIIAPAWTIFRSMSLVKRTMPQSMPNSASFASRISLLLSVMLFLIPIILCKNYDAADMSKSFFSRPVRPILIARVPTIAAAAMIAPQIPLRTPTRMLEVKAEKSEVAN